MPRVLGLLPQQMRLQSEYVVEHPIDPPSLQAVVSDDPSTLEVLTQRGAELAVDPALATNLRLLEEQ